MVEPPKAPRQPREKQSFIEARGHGVNVWRRGSYEVTMPRELEEKGYIAFCKRSKMDPDSEQALLAAIRDVSPIANGGAANRFEALVLSELEHLESLEVELGRDLLQGSDSAPSAAKLQREALQTVYDILKSRDDENPPTIAERLSACLTANKLLADGRKAIGGLRKTHKQKKVEADPLEELRKRLTKAPK